MLGDTGFPAASLAAVAATMPSVIGPVSHAARSGRDAVVAIAVADPRSPLHGVPAEDVVAERGYLFVRGDRDRRESYSGIMSRHGRPVEVSGSVQNTARHSFGTVFVEVRIRPRLGALRVSRVVAAYDPGRVLNHRTARGPVIGGVTWGIGFALMEHTVVDQNTARVVNPNLSGHLVPVCADTLSMEAFFVDRPDRDSKALGRPVPSARGDERAEFDSQAVVQWLALVKGEDVDIGAVTGRRQPARRRFRRTSADWSGRSPRRTTAAAPVGKRSPARKRACPRLVMRGAISVPAIPSTTTRPAMPSRDERRLIERYSA
ncbi:molybdopterin cofactor-binding domain-containing protein [Qaidamihabitans albus]|uniref:molybdopterin cofactor-binding domain-containing protein n=1 Tax=Qaidamihabitans albus TaxID=2795733 RepID=UPI0018F2745D|nr:molybdopterin cofactor-binding domain-containing protein [Qaidamihabitans albus]